MTNELQTLILSVPGTQDTRELDFKSVRDAVARGEIGLDNWVWSAHANDWLPLGHLPEFTSAQVYEEPTPIVEVAPEPQIARLAVRMNQPANATFVPAAHIAVATPNRMAATYYSKPIETSNEFPFFKILFAALALLIGGMVAVNYYLVDAPYHQNLAKSPFANLQTHAHLGAFIQPNALLIHLRPTPEITTDNFADVLSTLMKSAPTEALGGHPFSSIAITASWFGEYIISAENWKSFSDVDGLSPDQKRKFVLDRLERIDGQALVPVVRRDTPEVKKAREVKAWNELVSHFQSTTP